jgi:hypothetical protein
MNWITEWYKPGGSMSPVEIADNLCDFILTGLKKKSVLQKNIIASPASRDEAIPY